MTSRFIILAIVFNLANSLSVNAQNGEVALFFRVPNIKINNIINYPTGEIQFSDLKGKAILLDFGGTGCRGCVRTLPKLDSLERVYKGKLEVFWVTANTKEEINKFLHENKIGKTISIPIIAEDTLLHKLFPPTAEPTVVWVDVHGNFLVKSSIAFVQPSIVDYFVKYRMGETRDY